MEGLLPQRRSPWPKGSAVTLGDKNGFQSARGQIRKKQSEGNDGGGGPWQNEPGGGDWRRVSQLRYRLQNAVPKKTGGVVTLLRSLQRLAMAGYVGAKPIKKA